MTLRSKVPVAACLCLSVCIWTLVVYIGMPTTKRLLDAGNFRNTTTKELIYNLQIPTTTKNGVDEQKMNKCIHVPEKSSSEMKEREQGEILGRMEYVLEAAEPPPPLPFPDVETTKKNWSAHCSYPTYIPEHVQKVFSIFLFIYLFEGYKKSKNPARAQNELPLVYFCSKVNKWIFYMRVESKMLTVLS